MSKTILDAMVITGVVLWIMSVAKIIRLGRECDRSEARCNRSLMDE